MKFNLFLDSSNTDLIVAIYNGDKQLGKVQYEAWQRQSEMMIPEIYKLMDKHHLVKDELEGIIVTIGPGSYTGIRIALTIAKTISLALNCKVYPISSLYSMADFNNPSICLINARSKRSYIGVYDKNNVLLNDCIMENDDVIKYIESHKDYKVIGDVEYLKIDGEKPDISKQISFIYKYLSSDSNPLYIKPIYLKDTYEIKIN